jgi:hypothetical protein
VFVAPAAMVGHWQLPSCNAWLCNTAAVACAGAGGGGGGGRQVLTAMYTNIQHLSCKQEESVTHSDVRASVAFFFVIATYHLVCR